MDTKALRQKILDLAIRGRLVPQDPNDEPASVLLQRIREEKERLVKEGKIKKGKKSAKTSDTGHYENVPFDVPGAWEWTTLGEIAYVASGSTPSKEHFVPTGIPYIKMYNLRNQQIDFDFKPQYITEEVHNGKLQRSRTEVGDLIMNIVGPPLGKLALIPPSLPQANFNQAAVLIRPYLYKDILNLYLKYYLEEMTEINSITTRGCAGQVNISLSQSQRMRIPLPPLAEQHRIVAEIERWFSLIDIIESGKASLQAAVKQAKSKILDLAIHGKLVPQDPDDEPASELLRRINPKAEIASDNARYGNVPFEVPGSWAWTTLGEISDYGKSVNVAVNDIGDKEWVLELEDIEKDTANIIQRFYKSERAINGVRHKFRKGDVLYSKLRTYLNKALVASDEGYCTTEIMAFSTYGGLSNDYICHVLRSQYFLDYTLQCGYGVKMPRLSTTDACKGLVPLPPLAEQRRIVSKIEELFAQLDRIEAAL